MEVNNGICVSNQVGVDCNIFSSIVEHGKEVLEVHEKNEIPLSNQAGTDYDNVLSTVDHGEDIIDISGLEEEDVNHEIQEAVIVSETTSTVLNIDYHGQEIVEVDGLAKNEIEIKIPVSKLVYNIGLSKVNHDEEKLTDVDTLEEREIQNKVLRFLPDVS